MKKKKLKIIMQILIPILIAAVLISLYMIKNSSKEPVDNGTIDAPKEPVIKDNNNSTNPPEVPDPLDEVDFSLTTTSVNIKELSQYGLPMIIDYGSEGCGPCQAMKPALKSVNKKMHKKAFIKYIDVWQHPEAAEGLPVSLIPTQFFWNADGTPFMPSEELGNKIPFDLYYDNETNEHVMTAHVSPLSEAEMLEILAEMGVKIDD